MNYSDWAKRVSILAGRRGERRESSLALRGLRGRVCVPGARRGRRAPFSPGLDAFRLCPDMERGVSCAPLFPNGLGRADIRLKRTIAAPIFPVSLRPLRLRAFASNFQRLMSTRPRARPPHVDISRAGGQRPEIDEKARRKGGMERDSRPRAVIAVSLRLRAFALNFRMSARARMTATRAAPSTPPATAAARRDSWTATLCLSPCAPAPAGSSARRRARGASRRTPPPLGAYLPS